MAELTLGPMLRHLGERDATIWVETDAPCEVEVLDHTARTFSVQGHHYAIVCLDGLEPGTTYEYEVALDGVSKWPERGSGFPASRVRTFEPDGPFDISFGSCRVALPHDQQSLSEWFDTTQFAPFPSRNTILSASSREVSPA